MRVPVWCSIAIGLPIGLATALAWASPSPLRVNEIASGIYVHAGAQAEADSSNHGDIANIGFIVGSRCVAVIDTGGSPKIGRELRRAISGRTAKPVCYVINTHMHPDHVLGDHAFAGADAVFVAHAKFPRALAARARTYLDRAAQELTQKPDASWIVLPDKTVAATARLDLGGRSLVVHAWPTAHTNNDLSVYDPHTQTLWLSDLLFVNRVPALDGSIGGWLAALDRIAARTDVQRVVPGHGPVPAQWHKAIAREHEYLATVKNGVRKAIDAGHTLNYAVGHVAADERSRWLLFDDYNARNVTTAYTELEWQ